MAEMRDLKAEHIVELRVGEDNQVWVNVDEECRLRVSGAPDVVIIDDRLGALAYMPPGDAAKPADPTVAKDATVEP